MLLDLYFHHNGDSKSRAKVGNRLVTTEQQAAYWIVEESLKPSRPKLKPQVFEKVVELPDGSAIIGKPPGKKRTLFAEESVFEQAPPLHLSCLLLETFIIPSFEGIITAYVPVIEDLTDLEILLLFS